jgi:hypothetical protein
LAQADVAKKRKDAQSGQLFGRSPTRRR